MAMARYALPVTAMAHHGSPSPPPPTGADKCQAFHASVVSVRFAGVLLPGEIRRASEQPRQAELGTNSLVLYHRKTFLAIRRLAQTQNNVVKYYLLQFACKI
jgi:hypothetical protein